MLFTHVDAGIGSDSGPILHHRPNGNIEIQFVSILLVPHPHRLLRSKEINQPLQALGQQLIFLQQPIDVRRISIRW